MQEDEFEARREYLLDLQEIMQAFGVSEWSNLGPVASSHAELLSLLVEIQGQRYILQERQEGLAEEDSHHRYRFQSFLRESGIPILIIRAWK